MKKILYKSENFRLVSENVRNLNKVGKGKRYYTIEHLGWLPMEEEVRDMIDPKRSIGGKYATRWKFKDLAIAQKKWTMLMLKWGGE
ncbi:hypothetical protein UFOVP181_3 [uncultured Caudovirales phage]|uniref:Uncharacterized protein n=1 Tax=uncultured Caudovirales phage TaxID=2100421 RepID=A0A6J7WKE8_9CAUD|nr:hypothetical protein UFOVP57_161 [uncultured Caudovirales phage]CAB5208365.1 hypothetical protein UFOVP181_3 [uncultured Caudovirales phage]